MERPLRFCGTYARVRFRILSAILVYTVSVVCMLSTAHAAVIERIVAVVGDRPILLSDIKQRARPVILQNLPRLQSDAERNAFESRVLKEALERLIDERLEEQAADKARIQIASDEIDRAISNVGEQAKLSTRELMIEVRKTGRTEQEYRDEMRRQILEGKLLQLRLRGRVRVEEEDARAAYAKWVKEMGSDAIVDARIIALRLNPGGTQGQVAAREALAKDLVTKVRAGEDFCKMVDQYTDDLDARTHCGSPGPRPMGDLVPQLQEIVKSLQAGETSEPIRLGNEALLIVQLKSRSKIPSFAEMHDTMMQRAMGEVMERQRKSWLVELRRGTYVDIRL
jgi:peptidyl-prolyl cis-trans isomerase SurA